MALTVNSRTPSRLPSSCQTASNEARVQYPVIVGAVRPNQIGVDPDLIRYVAYWLEDYIRLKQLPGQSGVPEGVIACQYAFAEAVAAMSPYRQRQQDGIGPPGSLLSEHEPREVGTAEAAAKLGMSDRGVRWHCEQKNLEFRKVGRQLMITVASIEKFMLRKEDVNE